MSSHQPPRSSSALPTVSRLAIPPSRPSSRHSATTEGSVIDSDRSRFRASVSYDLRPSMVSPRPTSLSPNQQRNADNPSPHFSEISTERQIGIETRLKLRETFFQDPRTLRYIPYEQDRPLFKIPLEEVGRYIK